jgi:hypothetical protein
MSALLGIAENSDFFSIKKLVHIFVTIIYSDIAKKSMLKFCLFVATFADLEESDENDLTDVNTNLSGESNVEVEAVESVEKSNLSNLETVAALNEAIKSTSNSVISFFISPNSTEMFNNLAQEYLTYQFYTVDCSSDMKNAHYCSRISTENDHSYFIRSNQKGFSVPRALDETELRSLLSGKNHNYKFPLTVKEFDLLMGSTTGIKVAYLHKNDPKESVLSVSLKYPNITFVEFNCMEVDSSKCKRSPMIYVKKGLAAIPCSFAQLELTLKAASVVKKAVPYAKKAASKALNHTMEKINKKPHKQSKDSSIKHKRTYHRK